MEDDVDVHVWLHAILELHARNDDDLIRSLLLYVLCVYLLLMMLLSFMSVECHAAVCLPLF